MEDAFITGTCAQELTIPSDAPNTAIMPSKLAHKFALIGIPYLEEAWVSSYSKMVTSVWPLHASYCVWGT